MRTASSTASCAAGVWANTAVVTSKRVNRVRIAVLDARGTDLVAGPRGSAPLNLSCKHPVRSSEVAGTFWAYRRPPIPDRVTSELPVNWECFFSGNKRLASHVYRRQEEGHEVQKRRIPRLLILFLLIASFA